VAHWIFYEIDHILAHKGSLNKYKKTEITPLYSVRPQWKKTVTRKDTIQNAQTNGDWTPHGWMISGITEEIKGEVKKFIESNENENKT
jgi:hypothetical protein